MHKVACDICGQDYNVLPERMGDWLPCKMCQCQFEVAPHNFVDEDDVPKVSWSEWWESDPLVLTRRIIRGILIVAVMGWLTSLFFIEPPARVSFPLGELRPINLQAEGRI